MPTPVKSLDAMEKNLTAAERAARIAAEKMTQPQRKKVKLKPPGWLPAKDSNGGVSPEMKLWKSILKRMAGLEILDDLDAEALAIYCSLVHERDILQQDLNAARAEGLNMEKTTIAVSKQLISVDGRIAEYAERLGLTPSGRARLAQKRAQAAEEDPDGDLFG